MSDDTKCPKCERDMYDEYIEYKNYHFEDNNKYIKIGNYHSFFDGEYSGHAWDVECICPKCKTRFCFSDSDV